MTVFRIPAAVTVHLNANVYPHGRTLCGIPKTDVTTVDADTANDPLHDRVTCEACRTVLNEVRREKCLEPEPQSLLGVVCLRKVSADGTHDGLPHSWEVDTTPLTKTELEQALAGNPPPSDFTQREMEDFSGYVAYAAGAELDTPSDVLPRRVPGEALREAQEAALSEFESEGGTSGPGESARPGETNLARRVIERWPA